MKRMQIKFQRSFEVEKGGLEKGVLVWAAITNHRRLSG